MILDCHTHVGVGGSDRQNLRRRLDLAGIDGAIVISRPPECFPHIGGEKAPSARLNDVLGRCAKDDLLFPFYWVDPLEDDALSQVQTAADRGVAGFKIICDRYFPGDARALDVSRAIAGLNKPILFHAGILWDGKPSSRYCRPVEFEALIEVPRLRFALAHVAWPWCDELIAVYGKFLSAHHTNPDMSCEMFIDTCPGTPAIYREEVLRKLFTVGYDVSSNVMFGTDTWVNDYPAERARKQVEQDRSYLQSFGVSEADINKVFGGNALRFVDPTPSA